MVSRTRSTEIGVVANRRPDLMTLFATHPGPIVWIFQRVRRICFPSVLCLQTASKSHKTACKEEKNYQTNDRYERSGAAVPRNPPTSANRARPRGVQQWFVLRAAGSSIKMFHVAKFRPNIGRCEHLGLIIVSKYGSGGAKITIPRAIGR